MELRAPFKSISQIRGAFLNSEQQEKGSQTSDLVEKLALRKAKLEVSSLRADLLLKPFGLLTPIVLAVGIYLLIQAPEREAENRGQCIREIEFVGKFANQENSQSLDALNDFPFSCQPALAVFESRLNIKNSTASLDVAGFELEELADIPPPVDNSQNVVDDNCVRLAEAKRSERFRLLNEELGALSNERDLLIIEQQEATHQAQDAAAGRDGTGITQCGPNCISAQRRASELGNRTNSLVMSISELRRDVGNLQNEYDKTLSLCW